MLDQIHTGIESHGIVKQDVDLHGFREDAVGRVIGAVHICLDVVSIFDNVHRVRLGNLHEDGWLVIVCGLELVCCEAVIDRGDVGHADSALFGRLADDDVTKLIRCVGQLPGRDGNVAG